MADPQLYDVDIALRDLTRARAKRDESTRAACTIADLLAEHLGRHFAADELETAGRAVLIAAGSLGTLASEQIQPAVLVNVLAFAGGRMVNDGRDWHTALGRGADR